MAGKVNWAGVQAVIAAAEARGAVVGVGAIAPDGDRFSHHGARRFTAASTVKIPIMIELFRRIDAGKLSLDQTQALRAEDKSGGSGVMAHLGEGMVFSLADLCYLMMSISDNTATNLLIDHTGIAEVNATMQSLGMAHSTLGRKMRGRPRIEGEQENWATPDDYATVIAAILQGRAASPAACRQMEAVLEKQQNTRRIARHLDRHGKPRWGSKTGSLTGVVNDVGFIEVAGGALVIAVFVENPPDPHEGEQIIGDVAEAALQAVLAAGAA